MITGSIFRDALISGANNITSKKQQINELNVFPVPDGDTGTNMSMTIGSAARELVKLGDDCTVTEALSCTSSAMLRGARGNSGVILSLIFRGLSKALKGFESATVDDITKGLLLGTETAYKAVERPTEGTILTVIRQTSKKAEAFSENNKDLVPYWEYVCKCANEALAKTPEILPVLKKAGVVDAGGKGLCTIFEGMLSVFKDGVIISEGSEDDEEVTIVNEAEANEDELTFTYKAEYTVKKEKNNSHDPVALKAYLESIGDNVKFENTDDLIKVSLNTDNPGKAIQQGIKYGMLTDISVDNMREKLESKSSAPIKNPSPEYAPVDPDIPFGFVSVCAGDGIAQLFTDLGVDKIVSGGQTMNPSTEDILAAVQAVPAKTVFVLPNNKNIIMAAEQAVPLADREIRVLYTKTIPQGLSAMLCFDPENSASDNQIEMMKAAENVGSGQLTFAARDSDFEGHKIKEGEILALENGKLSFVDKDLQKAAIKLTKSLLKKDSSFITVLYGEGVNEEEANSMVDALKEKIPDTIDISLIEGKQPVYYYIISVE